VLEQVSREDLNRIDRSDIALQEGPQMFHQLLEHLPAAAYTCNPEGMIEYYNGRAVRLWGRAPKLHDPVERYCGSFKLFSITGDVIPHDRCWMALALQRNRDYSGQEIVIERPDGERITALAHASPLHDEAGRLVGAVNILVDITDRKQADEALCESQALFEAFMRYSPVVSFLKGEDDRLLFVNRAFEDQIWDGDPPDWQGLTSEELWPPVIAQKLRENDQRILTTGEPEILEETIVRAGVEEVWLSFKFPVRRPAGGMYLAGMALNISARKRLEDERRALEARLEEAKKLAGLGAVAGTMAEDLEGLLTSLLDRTGQALQELPAGSPCAAALTAIAGDARGAADLVRQLRAAAQAS
jgi:PAS domain S-box-containing protein